MTDRELLEASAKAAGVVGVYVEVQGTEIGQDACGIGQASARYCDRLWNPLEDDGDAFRLAISLRVALLPSCPQAQLNYPHGPKFGDGDPNARRGARRAIVRAAGLSVPAAVPAWGHWDEFKTAKQAGAVAGDGKPCQNDHDPDCRWPQCRCRETPNV